MRIAFILLLWVSVAVTGAAQQFKFDLENLASKASEHVDVSLNSSTLRFAARFLDTKDPEEVKVAKLIAGLEGIYIRSFEFKNQGAWTQADLEGIRSQLRAPAWSRIVGVKSEQDGETDEVYLRTENKQVTGVAILAAEPKQITVVNIVGPIDLDSLAELGGHMGIPKVGVPAK